MRALCRKLALLNSLPSNPVSFVSASPIPRIWCAASPLTTHTKDCGLHEQQHKGGERGREAERIAETGRREKEEEEGEKNAGDGGNGDFREAGCENNTAGKSDAIDPPPSSFSAPSCTASGDTVKHQMESSAKIMCSDNITDENHARPRVRVSDACIIHENTGQNHLTSHVRISQCSVHAYTEQNHVRPDARVFYSCTLHEDTEQNHVTSRVGDSHSSVHEDTDMKLEGRVSSSASTHEDTDQMNNVEPDGRVSDSCESRDSTTDLNHGKTTHARVSDPCTHEDTEQNHVTTNSRVPPSATTHEDTGQMKYVKSNSRSPSPSLFSSSSGATKGETVTEQMVREWANLRKTRLTASVFAFAIGFWEGRRVQLWKEKIGILEPFQGNLATNWGTLKETPAIEQYIKLTDNKVHHQLFKSYPQGTSMPDWMGASPDGLVYSRSAFMLENGGILEVKCPFNRGRPDIGVPWPYVPYYYMPQAQGLMEIFDRNWLDFYVWTLNGSSIYRIDRNPDLWELMLTALNDFWWGHVVPAKHLLSKEGGDADLRRFKPGPHHALFLTIANKCKVLADKSPLLLHDRNPRLVR